MHKVVAVLALSGVIRLGVTAFGADATVVPTLHIDAGNVTAKVSPTLYGLMTEEINHSYDGGLYGELIQNRSFLDDAQNPVHWQLMLDAGGNGTMSLDPSQPLNPAQNTSLKLDISSATANQRVGIANDGFWGVPILPSTNYNVSFYAKASTGFNVPLTVALVSNDGQTVFAKTEVLGLTSEWQKRSATLTTGNVPPTKDARFLIWATSPGTVWFDMVSLFPPTWNDRTNGNRKDIMQLLSDMKPTFLRFPGGNYLQGNTIVNRFDWKKTLGDAAQRPGHLNDSWGYRSSDGMGLLEFLEWCEDLHIEPVLGVFSGDSVNRRGLNGKQKIDPGDDLKPYVQDALDEIEYVTGDVNTQWGAQRAKDGHPEPFKLHYVEIGNEDNNEQAPNTYTARFNQFADAFRAKYPELKLIATFAAVGIHPDVVDDHYYKSPLWMKTNDHRYDATDRSGPKIFVGEWATRGSDTIFTPKLEEALGDAAWLTGLERNSDIVIMSCYAPLFSDVSEPKIANSPGASTQWRINLIGFDALHSYGSPSYYVQKIFSNNHGDEVVAAKLEGMPEPAPVAAVPATLGTATQPVPSIIFYVATIDSKTGKLYIKVVNAAPTPQDLQINITGLGGIFPDGQMTVMSSGDPKDTNSIGDPMKVVPVTSQISGLGTNFEHTFPANSITALVLQGR